LNQQSPPSPSPNGQVKTAVLTKNEANTNDKIAINLIKMLRDGPIIIKFFFILFFDDFI
jgi:hypothetical protein